MTTWADVRIGDAVTGADGREWTVVERGRPRTWLADGVAEAKFQLALGDRKVWTVQRLIDPIHIARPSEDRAQMAAAWSALTDGGFAVTITQETTVPADPFMSPGEAPSAVKRKPAPTGQYGWYKLPHPVTGEPDRLFPRVSTIAGTLADRFGLELWGKRQAVKGIAMRDDLIAAARALDPDSDKSKFDELVKTAEAVAATKRGATLGDAVHKFAERLDAGESIAAMGVPGDLVRVVEAYAMALKRAKLTVLPEYNERTVVNAEHGYAGTIDRIVRAADGTLRILDLKTGKDVAEYGSLEFGVQQACYARAPHMCSRDFRSYEQMPTVDQAKTLILHIPIAEPETAEIYGLDIVKGWAAAQLALSVRATRADARKGWMWSYSPGTPVDAVRLRLQRATSLDELMTEASTARKVGLWSDELEAVALAQYDIVRAGTAESREALAALWAELEPAGRWTAVVSEVATMRAAALAPVEVS